ncbi:MAG: tetratricopeptide repeat protein [Cyanobacteria bacterium P01_F01_bin.150]
MYLDRWKYTHARDSFIEAKVLYERSGLVGEDARNYEYQQDYIKVLLKLGSAYLGLETNRGYADALKISEYALDLTEDLQKIEEDDEELDDQKLDKKDLLILERHSHDNIGNAYLGQERYGQAFVSLQRSSESTSQLADRIEQRLGKWPQHIRFAGAASSLLNFVLPGSSSVLQTIAGLATAADQGITATTTGFRGVHGLLNNLSSDKVKDSPRNAAEALENAREAASNSNDVEAEINALMGLGLAYFELQKFEEADQAFADALELLSGLSGGTEQEFEALLGRSNCQYSLSRYREAEEFAQDALAKYQQLESADTVGTARVNLIISNIRLGQGEYRQAIFKAEEALTLLEETGTQQRGKSSSNFFFKMRIYRDNP